MRRDFWLGCEPPEVDVSKHSDLANRIFRTVVFSGAMLGASAAFAQPNPAPQKQADKAPVPAKADTWDSVNKELETNHTKLAAAVSAYANAVKAKKNVEPALAKVTELRTARTDLDARIGKTERPPFVNEKAMPGVEKAEAEWSAADKALMAALDAVPNAKEDADVKKAVDELTKANKARTAAWVKVKAERAKANRRPRAPVTERPTGRGFILS